MSADRQRAPWTADEVRALGVRTDVETAGSVIGGLSRTQAYEAVKAGRFPVPVIKVGRRLVVPVQPILTLLRLDAPGRETAGPAPPGPAIATTALAPLPDEDSSSR